MTDSKPSKSARKREQLERQALGEKLIALSDTELGSLPLDEKLGEAIRGARKITSHEALRRQKQLIGKLMRDIDLEPVRSQLLALQADELRLKRAFAAAEKWRDRIVGEGAAGLDAFETEIGATDTTLRSLLAELEVAVSDRAETTARRNIFRRVYELLA